MGGRRKNYDGPGFAGRYTIETAEFWEGDQRLHGLSILAQFTFFKLGLWSVIKRREILPLEVTWEVVRQTVGKSVHTRSRDMAAARTALVGRRLIDETADGRIIVCGARKRRPNLQWKDEEDIRGINGYSFDIKPICNVPKESKKGKDRQNGVLEPPFADLQKDQIPDFNLVAFDPDWPAPIKELWADFMDVAEGKKPEPKHKLTPWPNSIPRPKTDANSMPDDKAE